MDSSICYYKDMWWIFTTDRDDYLRLYYADSLFGSLWVEHPESPIIVENANIARPGGRVLILDKRMFRFAQDDEPTYGNKVRAFEVVHLTTETYEEKQLSPDPILEPSGAGWNAFGMHHIDLHQIQRNKWIACVDGYGENVVFGLKY